MEAPDVPASEQLGFRLRTTTRWSDEDNHGVLNNAVYSTLFEEVRLAWCRELGLLVDNKFPFVLAQSNVRFVTPGRGGVEVEVELGTVRLGKSSFEQVYRVRESAGGSVWCEARALLVAWDHAAGGSAPMTPAFRARVAEHEGLE